jgi:hypothetical protein
MAEHVATTAETRRRRPAGRLKDVRFVPAAVEISVVLAATVALALYIVWPLPYHLDEWISGYPGDSTGFIAYLWAMAHGHGFNVVGTSHVDFWGAPFGYEEDSSVNLTIASTLFPSYLLAELGHEIAAYNLVVISGLALSGAAMYWLVRYLGAGRLAAGWSGVVFMVFPWHLEKAQGHAAYVHLEGFPLLLLALLAWRSRPDWRRGVLVVAAYAFIWLTAGYFGLVATVALVLLGPAIAIGHLRTQRPIRALGRSSALAGGLLAVPATLYVTAAAGEGGTGAVLQRRVEELLIYGARPWEYLVPSYRHPYFGDKVGPWLLENLHGSNFSETSLYVGWITIALAVFWLSAAVIRRSTLSAQNAFVAKAFLALIVAGLAFSLPSPLWTGGPVGPARLLWELTPYFRVPTRFIALVMTALVPLAALGLARLAARFERPILRVAFVGVVAAASFWELSFVPPRLLTDVGTPPAEYAAVERAPRGSLAEYPLVAQEFALNSEYLFWQRVHERPLLNGAPDGTFSDAVRETLVGPGDPATPPSLAALGVSVIVVHGDFYPGAGMPPPPEALGPGYRQIATYPDGSRVLRVVASPAPAHALYTSGFGPSEIAGPRTTARWLGADRGRIEFMTWRAGVYRARFSLAAYERPQRLHIAGFRGQSTLPAPPRGGSVELVLRLPRGRSWVEVSASPGLRPIPDGRRVSVYVGNWQFEPAATPAVAAPLVPFSASR